MKTQGSIFILVFIMMQNFCYTQNLVTNPSFEDTIQCLSTITDGNLIGWINCGNTPDYYNSCANTSPTDPQQGVPYGIYVGFQYPLDGNAYVGLASYSNPASGHEWIGNQLLSALIPGTKYFASAYISMSNIIPCSSNNLGFRFFTTMPFNSSNAPSIDNFSHIVNTTIINDTLNWVKITGSFISDSSYQYLVFGNFYDNSNTDTSNCPAVSISYYLIDAVCVTTDSIYCNNWTKIKVIDNLKSKIFPNPSNESIKMSEFLQNAKYIIISSIGEKIISGYISEREQEISIDSLENGIYYIIVENFRTFKFVVQH